MSITGMGEIGNGRVGELGWVSAYWVAQPDFMCERAHTDCETCNRKGEFSGRKEMCFFSRDPIEKMGPFFRGPHKNGWLNQIGPEVG